MGLTGRPLPHLWLPSSLSTSTCTHDWSEDRTELSDAEMGQFSYRKCTAGQGKDSGHRQRWVPRTSEVGGLPDARTLAASGVRQMPMWVFCLDGKLLGSSFPVLPHPCQTLHSTIKRPRADSYPPVLTVLQLGLQASVLKTSSVPVLRVFNAFRFRNLLVDILYVEGGLRTPTSVPPE